jgi:hypothetical protein
MRLTCGFIEIFRGVKILKIKNRIHRVGTTKKKDKNKNADIEPRRWLDLVILPCLHTVRNTYIRTTYGLTVRVLSTL